MGLWWLCWHQNCWGACEGGSEFSHMLLSLHLCLVTHFPHFLLDWDRAQVWQWLGGWEPQCLLLFLFCFSSLLCCVTIEPIDPAAPAVCRAELDGNLVVKRRRRRKKSAVAVSGQSSLLCASPCSVCSAGAQEAQGEWLTQELPWGREGHSLGLGSVADPWALHFSELALSSAAPNIFDLYSFGNNYFLGFCGSFPPRLEGALYPGTARP